MGGGRDINHTYLNKHKCLNVYIYIYDIRMDSIYSKNVLKFAIHDINLKYKHLNNNRKKSEFVHSSFQGVLIFWILWKKIWSWSNSMWKSFIPLITEVVKGLWQVQMNKSGMTYKLVSAPDITTPLQMI